MNKNYVQTNQYLENKSGNHKNLDAQKGEWYHRKVKGDFTEVVILKDKKYRWKRLDGKEKAVWRYSMNKTRVCESSWPGLVKKSKSYTRSCTGTVIRYKALKIVNP